MPSHHKAAKKCLFAKGACSKKELPGTQQVGAQMLGPSRMKKRSRSNFEIAVSGATDLLVIEPLVLSVIHCGHIGQNKMTFKTNAHAIELFAALH